VAKQKVMEQFKLSFRNSTTDLIWIHDFVIPDSLPFCNATKVVGGEQCNGDGRTLKERLSQLNTLSHFDIESNSSSGRLCPSDPGIVYTTTITFKAPNTPMPTDKIVSGSMGDVPLVYIVSESFSNTTEIAVSENRKGSADFISEVQVLERIDSGEGVGYFHLQYNVSLVLVPANASAEEFRSAVAILIGICDLTNPCAINDDLVVTKKTVADTISNFISNRWTVTFPKTFGRAFLLQVYALCSFNNDVKFVDRLYTDQTNYAQDYWEGSSCLLSTANRFISIRVVSGYSSLSGNIAIGINDIYSDVKLNSIFHDLMEISTVEVNQFYGGKSNLTQSYYLYFPSENISLISVKDSLKIKKQ
jgi:hypothetical protein